MLVRIVGHTRKPPIGFDAQLTAYDTRGSGAIVDALRSVRMLDLMTVEKAQKRGISGSGTSKLRPQNATILLHLPCSMDKN